MQIQNRITDRNLATAGTIADGVVYGVPYAEAQGALDPDVIAAIARLRDIDPNSIGQLEAALTTHAGVFAETHLLNSVDGVTAEEIASKIMGGTLHEATNAPVSDFAVGDHLYQVKEGMSAADAGLAAARAHPEATIVTDVVSAADLHEHGVNAVGLAGLAPEHIHDLVAQTVDGVDLLSDIAIPIPMVSAVIAIIREIKRVNANEIGSAEAIANVAVHVGSRATGMGLFMGLASAVLAVPTGGAVPVALAVLGALAGGMAAKGIVRAGIPRAIVNAIKEPRRKYSP